MSSLVKCIVATSSAGALLSDAWSERPVALRLRLLAAAVDELEQALRLARAAQEEVRASA